MKTAFILLATCLVLSQAFYGPETDVVKLTSSNFQSEVVDSDDFWLIEFYAPWCGHCKKLTPEWQKAAKGLKGIVRMGAVDMTTDQEAGKDYDVQGFPTLKWFGDDKANPIEFDGGRTSVGIINYAMKKLKEIANTRIGNTRRNTPKAPKKEKKEEEPVKEEEQQEEAGEDQVVVITEENFEELIGTSTEAWFVEFYAPWCGHCKTLAPIWSKFAAAVKGKINVAKCDATVGKRELSETYSVKGYPSLKWFPSGAKDADLVLTYEGQRDLESIQRYAEEQQALSKPAELTQIVNQSAFDERCVGVRGACIILFVPNLADSTVEDRVRYLAQYVSVANRYRGKPFSFLWSEGGANFDFEQGFNVGGAGYPAVVAISTKKSVYAQLRGSFNESNLASFVAQVGQGKGGFQKYNVLPAIKAAKAWESPVQKEEL